MKLKLAFLALMLGIVLLGFVFALEAPNNIVPNEPSVCTTAITENDVPIRINGEWHDYIPRCQP